MTDDLRTRAREAAEWLYPEPQYDSLTYPHGAVRGYMRVAFIKGALWHAAQQPTREQIAEVLAAQWFAPSWEQATSGQQGQCLRVADRVLALLNGAGS